MSDQEEEEETGLFTLETDVFCQFLPSVMYQKQLLIAPCDKFPGLEHPSHHRRYYCLVVPALPPRRNHQTGVEACLILGELKMGTDALLAAILSGVLRPRAQSKEFGRAAVTVADIEEVRDVSVLMAYCYMRSLFQGFPFSLDAVVDTISGIYRTKIGSCVSCALSLGKASSCVR